MNIRTTPYIDPVTAREWAATAADAMRCLAPKPKSALIRMLLDAILSDGKRKLPTGVVVYLADERKLLTQLAVQRLAATLLASAQDLKGNWELGAWHMFSPAIPWQINLPKGAMP